VDAYRSVAHALVYFCGLHFLVKKPIVGIFAASAVLITSLGHAESPKGAATRDMPRPDHVVIVIDENKSFGQIINNPAAPYINSLAKSGAVFTQSFAVAHPSQPNYLALFSGDTHGVPDDRCPLSLSGDNLVTELVRNGFTFATYLESIPTTGYMGCVSGNYYRKHNPGANWQGTNVSPDLNRPFIGFHWNYSKLPTVSFVVPNQLNDMHDGEPVSAIRRGDDWLKANIDPFIKWAARNNSLLILTWDEDDGSDNNRIPTIFVGPMVKPGTYSTRIDHYDVLRTIVDMYGLRPLGKSSAASRISTIWTISP
jgi:phosphatidylinositol-3-phosphatase